MYYNLLINQSIVDILNKTKQNEIVRVKISYVLMHF